LLTRKARAAELAASARSAGAELWTETTALGVYREDSAEPLGVLLSTARGTVFVRAHRLLLASGCHDATPTFAGNDLPGVFSARAGLELLAHGITPGRRVAVIGGGELAEQAREQLGVKLALSIEDPSVVEAVGGRQQVRWLRLREGKDERRVAADALLYAAPGAPAFELAVQAGGSTRFESALGYVPEFDRDGRLAPRVFCAGRLTGSSNQPATLVARRIAAELQTP
jgi:sarcosine oxidase subunit alpha